MGFKIKLHQLNPEGNEPTELEIQSTKRRKKTIIITPQSNQRAVREILAGHYHHPYVLAMDPHRLVSATRRRMPAKKKKPDQPSKKMLQTFFCTDMISRQPLAFTMGSSGKSCGHATRQLLELLARGGVGRALLVADKEHFTKDLLATIADDPTLDILMAAPSIKKITRQFPRLDYTLLWAGYAIGETAYNLNIRHGKGSLALLAQAATHQLKSRLPAPYKKWTARHLAEQVLTNMEGDLRVKDDTIIVTYYRDHQQLELVQHYQNRPQILASEGVCPKIPWLFDFKLDFRFK